MGARLERHRIGPAIRMLHTATDPLFRRGKFGFDVEVSLGTQRSQTLTDVPEAG
jgi:hypothetical protein